MSAPEANAVPIVDDNCTGQVRPMHQMQARPTFHVSREMVCFVAGIAVTVGILWICTNMKNKH